MGTRIVIDDQFTAKEYLSGKTLVEIGNSLGVSKDIIKRSLKESGIILRRSGRRRLDIENGKRFGSLTIVKHCTIKSKHPQYICKCDCGEITKSTASELIKGKSRCWTCRNKLISKSRWKGVGEISGDFWDRLKRSANARSIDLCVSMDQAWSLFLKQKRLCALSGTPICFHRSDLTKTTASLDRIDSSKNYTIDNVQWVHKIINTLKMDLSDSEFIGWCAKVTKWRNYV